MRLAVLGTDEDVVALIAAANDAGHVVEWLADVRPDDATAVRQLLPAVPVDPNWEAVLDHAVADAVIVGTGSCGGEERIERLKRLIADGIATLTVFPIGISVLPYFELDMIRRATGGVLRHYNPLADTVAVERVARWVREGHETVGAVRQVAWQRRLAGRDQQSVFSALARDADVIPYLVGNVTKVSAFGPQDGNTQFASLNLQLSAAGDVTVTWSVAPNDGAHQAEITLVGERGQHEIPVTTDPVGMPCWDIDGSFAGHGSTETHGGLGVARSSIDQFAVAVGADPAGDVERSTWETATRAMEIVDAVQLSLQRGRTIEILHQQLTEQLAFRGMMSALGCGVLLLGLFVMLVAVLVLGLVGDAMQLPLVGSWPIALVGLLLFFLLLQLVPYTRRR